MFCTGAVGAELTHGPMVGHTTHTTTRIWVRADEQCDLQVRLVPQQGGDAKLSEKVRLLAEDNFCGSVRTDGLSSKTTYSYHVMLDDRPQDLSTAQRLTTFPPPGESGVVRIGFGHSLIGSKVAVTHQVVADVVHPVAEDRIEDRKDSSAKKLRLDSWTYVCVDDSRGKWGDWDKPDWLCYFGLAMADVTGDGYGDIVAGRYFYRNPGGAMTGKWVRSDLGLNVDGMLFVMLNNLDVADMDGDCDIIRLPTHDGRRLLAGANGTGR